MRECLGGKPGRGMKVKRLALGRRVVGGPPVGWSAPSTDHESLTKDSSLSVDVGTRKIRV